MGLHCIVWHARCINFWLNGPSDFSDIPFRVLSGFDGWDVSTDEILLVLSWSLLHLRRGQEEVVEGLSCHEESKILF